MLTKTAQWYAHVTPVQNYLGAIKKVKEMSLYHYCLTENLTGLLHAAMHWCSLQPNTCLLSILATPDSLAEDREHLRPQSEHT